MNKKMTVTVGENFEVEGIEFFVSYSHNGRCGELWVSGYSEEFEAENERITTFEWDGESDEVEIEITDRNMADARRFREFVEVEAPQTERENQELDAKISEYYEAETKRLLEGVMTTREISEAYGIADATVRQTIARGAIKSRKSGNTHLIRKEDAEARWGQCKTE